MVARKVMAKSAKIYDGVREILKRRCVLGITKKSIDDLCRDIIDMMLSWNKHALLCDRGTESWISSFESHRSLSMSYISHDLSCTFSMFS